MIATDSAEEPWLIPQDEIPIPVRSTSAKTVNDGTPDLVEVRESGAVKLATSRHLARYCWSNS